MPEKSHQNIKGKDSNFYNHGRSNHMRINAFAYTFEPKIWDSYSLFLSESVK